MVKVKKYDKTAGLASVVTFVSSCRVAGYIELVPYSFYALWIVLQATAPHPRQEEMPTIILNAEMS